jgi:DNA topoisomerase-3
MTSHYLLYLFTEPSINSRLYNKTTEQVYSLPIGGELKQWTGRHCPVVGCNFELCLYSVGAPARTFPLCPNCFNNPRPEWGPVPGENAVAKPGEEDDEVKERSIRRLAGKNICRECPHGDKVSCDELLHVSSLLLSRDFNLLFQHPLIEDMTVSPDPDSGGVLILDPHLGPKVCASGFLLMSIVILYYTS